jgi:CO/xanthine dehydrogenase FAD-binding subunit
VEIGEAEGAEGAKLNASAIRNVAEAACQHAHPMKNLCELPPSYRRQMVDVFVESAVTQARAAAGK